MTIADPARTATFRLLTSASATAVWQALTCASTSPRYLHGLSVRTTWVPGATVLLSGPSGLSLTGEVLHVQPGARLSLVLEETTYLTWTLRACGDATVVRLEVDEAGSTEDELEEVWLPVMDRLATVLREPSGAG